MRTSIQFWFRTSALAGVLFLFWLSQLSAQSGAKGNWSVFSNIQFSQSNLETGETYSGTYIYSGFRYYSEKFSFSLSIPLIYQRGQGLISDSGGIPVNTGTTGEFHSNGVGDAFVSFDYNVINNFAHQFQVSINLESKIPTASSALGTGKFDFGGYINLKKYVQSWFFMANMGYLLMGDNETTQFENPFILGTGIGKFFLNHHLGTFFYFERYSSWVINTDPPRYGVFGMSYRMKSGMFLSSYLQKGFSETAPDWLISIGMDIKIR